MIDHALVLHHATLVGKHVIVGFGGIDEVRARPVLPVYKVGTHGKGVEGIVPALRMIGREVEHHVERAGKSLAPVVDRVGKGHLHDLCVSRDDARYLMCIDGIARIAFPMLHVVGQCYADAFGLEIVLRIHTACIVKHHEAFAECLGFVFIDRALVLHKLLPPLRPLVMDA